jgi:hypothetical protein
MPIERSKRPVAVERMAVLARSLLDASPLCAIATVSPGGRAHVNTAYFAWSPRFDIVWLSEARARHLRNIAADGSVAIAVFDSNQTWGEPDRGIQLFGSARETEGATPAKPHASTGRDFPTTSRRTSAPTASTGSGRGA